MKCKKKDIEDAKELALSYSVIVIEKEDKTVMSTIIRKCKKKTLGDKRTCSFLFSNCD